LAAINAKLQEKGVMPLIKEQQETFAQIGQINDMAAARKVAVSALRDLLGES